MLCSRCGCRHRLPHPSPAERGLEPIGSICRRRSANRSGEMLKPHQRLISLARASRRNGGVPGGRRLCLKASRLRARPRQATVPPSRRLQWQASRRHAGCFGFRCAAAWPVLHQRGRRAWRASPSPLAVRIASASSRPPSVMVAASWRTALRYVGASVSAPLCISVLSSGAARGAATF